MAAAPKSPSTSTRGKSHMKILVYGAGAVGSLLGGFLARGGHDVTLLGRAPHMEAVNSKGLRVTGIWGDFTTRPQTATDGEVLIAKRDPWDIVLFTVKSYDTRKVFPRAAVLVGPRTTFLSFQNGLDNLEAARQYIPNECRLAGRIITGVEITQPGEVRVTVSADPPAIGKDHKRGMPLSPEAVASLFTDCNLPTVPTDCIESLIWSKAIYNCALNAPCSLRGIPYGELMQDKQAWEISCRIVRECYAVAEACYVHLEPATAEGYIELLEKRLVPITAGHYPSMLQDFRKSRTEIDSLNGAISRRGRRYEIPTPANDSITEAIKAGPKSTDANRTMSPGDNI